MFGNFFQNFGNPAIQEGRIIQNPQEIGTEKPVILDEDGVVTEEGFVSIGQSSFIYSASGQAYSSNTPVPPLYPSIPSTQNQQKYFNKASNQFGKNVNVPGVSYPMSTQVHQQSYQDNRQGNDPEMLRGLPFILHPDLKHQLQLSHINSGNQLMINRQDRFDNTKDFNYDFEFERRVLQDINQQFGLHQKFQSASNYDQNQNF